MIRQKIQATLTSFVISVMLALAVWPSAYADDTDIYTQVAPNSAGTPSVMPLVVLTLDLNLNPTDVVCSNILADPNTLTGSLVEKTACKGLQQAAVIPVLGDVLNLNVGGVLNTLLGDGSLVGGLLGALGGGLGLSDLTNALQPIVGSDSIVGNVVSATQLDVLRLLLYRVIHQLVGVRLAIMVSHADTCAKKGIPYAQPRRNTENCSNGAYFLLTPTELLEDNLNQTTDSVLARLSTLQANFGSVTNDENTALLPPFQGKEIYYELYRHLTGKSVYNAPLNADDLVSIQDPAVSGNSYTSPLDDTTCQDIHVINIMFTDSKDDDDSDAAILGDPGLPGIGNNGGGKFTFGDVAKYFATVGFDYKNVRYRVKSQYLLNGPAAGGVGGLLSNLTNTVASLPIGLNPLALPFVTKENFEPVNATSASFDGPQPVFLRSDLTQASDSLYYGTFKPNEYRDSAWRGNLKKLRLSEQSGVLTIVDAEGRPAIAANGNLRPAALTYWTDAASLADISDLPEEEQRNVINGRDGPSVDRGGAGSHLLPPRTKATKENPNNAKGSGSKQNANTGARVFYQAANAQGQAGGVNIQPLQLDDKTVNDADKVITDDADGKNGHNKLDTAIIMAYARGYETNEGDFTGNNYKGFLAFLGGTVSGVLNLVGNILDGVLSLPCKLLGIGCPTPQPPKEPPAQPWIMGDVLHSTPLPIDYGNDDVRIFTGTNRGFLHQIRDTGRSSDPSSFGGQEVWRVAPRTMLPKFNQWRAGATSGSNRPYGVDGAPVPWIKDTDGEINASDGDHVYLYFGLRRGGKSYYALDVTDPDAAPAGLWEISKTSGTNSDFGELGLTFSTPRIGKIRTRNTNGTFGTRTALVFAGGYSNTAQNKDNNSGSENAIGRNDTEGNAIYVVDAQTGALIWKAKKGGSAGSKTSSSGAAIWEHPNFEDSIPSDVTALDTTGDGLLDRLYVADTGGRLWRADIGASDPTQWRAAPIANLGRHAAQSNNVVNDRRFFARPDVVRVNNGANSFYAVILGSGNRADPLNRNTSNKLYVVKDRGELDSSAAAQPVTDAELADFTNNCATGSQCDSLLNAQAAAKGWKITLGGPDDSGRRGEKVFSSPVTIAGKVMFTSYVPPALSVNACTPQEGTGRRYAIDLLNARGVLPLYSQDGEPGADVHVDYSRGTRMAAAGIPAGVQYIRPKTFLSSDFGIINVDHKTTFRTYWRERDGER